MHTPHLPATTTGLKRFNIRICTGRETALQTCIARTQAQAWNMAFALAERLLGERPPRSISVRPVAMRSGLYPQAAQALEPFAVRAPMHRSVGGGAPIGIRVDAPTGVGWAGFPVTADEFLGPSMKGESHDAQAN